MRKTLFFVGVGLIASIIAAVYILRNKKKKYNDSFATQKPDAPAPVANTILTEDYPIMEDAVCEDAKRSSVWNIHSRHKDAATIIRDSVETIRNNAKVSEDTNKEIDEVSAEFEKMLSEDKK